MEELQQQIMDKLGIDLVPAEGAIQHILEFVKGKLPESVHGLIDGALHPGEGGEAEGW